MRLARNPVFGDFGRYSRMFSDVFGFGRPYQGFNKPYDYYNYPDYYDYSFRGGRTNDYYDTPDDSGYDYDLNNRPGVKSKINGYNKKNQKYVGVKLSNKVEGGGGADHGHNSTAVPKYKAILNQIKYGNVSMKRPDVETSRGVDAFGSKKTSGSTLKKLKTPSHLVAMKFPKIEKLAAKIASSLDDSYVENVTKKNLFLVPSTTTTSAPTTTTTTATRAISKVASLAALLNGSLKSSLSLKNSKLSTSERKFPKIDRLASRIVSHFV